MSRLNKIKKIRYKLHNADSLELSKEKIEFLCDWAEKGLVAIPKTETTTARALRCWYCTEIEKHGVVVVKTVLDKSGRELDAYETPYNYCPNCGRRLEETPCEK